ncbi:MAG: hypothetical protein JST75_03390 [Bacteroidetes bacterium]|nr:hypothetical protein [Bacteroidota bacterium]
MNLYFSTLLSFGKRFLLLIIYVVFFIVQFFFNFRSDSSISFNEISYHNSLTGKQKNFLAAKPDHNHKPGFRLNKRFQPAIVPDIVCSAKEIPVKYLNRSKINKPDDYLLISFILATSLRGPPALS